MCAERIAENIIICVDTSRSMARTDYRPNRLKASVDAIKKLISERLAVDPSSFFAIVKFSSKSKKLIDFTNYKEELYEILDRLEFSGKSAMGEALGLSIKMIIAELRKIAAKTPRILLVTDGIYSKMAIDPMKMARLAQGLKIKIDSMRLGALSSNNILKKISDITGGKYFYNNDSETLLRSAHDLAISNVKTYGGGIGSLIENSVFLRKIAADLLRVQDLTKDQEQRLLQIRGLADYKKCSICFSDTNPYTKSSFYISGRYCPSCQTPYHIHCLAGWADSQKDAKMRRAGAVRCPHCFYLLKIPTEITQIQKFKTLTKPSIHSREQPKGPQQFDAKIVKFDSDAMFSSCLVCHLIFEDGGKIVKCGNCQTLYHEHCFKELKNGQCKNCESFLKL